MDHVRVMGVCLLLAVIAVALPIDGLAFASNGIAGSGANLENGGLAVPTSLSTIEIAYTPVGPMPFELWAAQENNTSADETIANETALINASEVNETFESNATSLQGVITPDMIPGENATTSEITFQENATGNINDSTQINETPTNITTSENITPEDITFAANITNETTNITNITTAAFALNATPLENATSTNETAVPEVMPVGGAEEAAAPAEEAAEYGQNRIWRQGINPLDYTWTPQSFSGFFFDLKDEVGAETLTVHLGGSESSPNRAIDENNLVYKSNVQLIRYKFEDWGTYQVMGFMADKYFAGYGATEIVDSNISLINDGQLRKVLIDTDDEHTITAGSVLPLEEGYELRIKEVDVNGNKAYMSLARDGKEIDSKVISPDDLKSSTYQYEVDVSGEDVPIIMAHISNVFASAESSLATVNGLFQVSEDYASVQSGDMYGKMKVTSVDDSGITMKNDNTLTLRKGGTVNIFGNVAFLVADADVLRFAPTVERTGTYTVRGSIIRPADYAGKEFTWNPYNFEGFFYDIDDDIGTENLTARFTGSSSIEENNLIYETSPMSVKFKLDDWGRYDVIGFMADKYFAGYNEDTQFTDSFSAINEGQLRKVLIDSDNEQTISTGSVLALEEGYELRIKQVDINGNKVYLSLARDGKEVDSKVVTPSSASDRASNYMYKVTVGSETDVPIITAHILSVFRGTETDLATIDGLFQVSDNPESVEEGEVYDKMKIRSLSDSIRMTNDATVSLARNRITTIMGNLQFQIADNLNKDLAPIAQKTVSGSLMTLTVPGAVVGKEVQINVKAGTEALSGVQISVARQNIGNTDETGNVSYTPSSTGTLDVLARKAGYGDATGSLVVSSSAEAVSAAANQTLSRALTINVPSEVNKGDSFIITVVGGTNQTPMENVNILFDNTSIGSTNADGTLTYSANETGEHTITAEAEGYENAVRKIAVISPIVVNSISVPTMANTGDSVKVTANVQNTGTEKDTETLQLRVNDNVTDSKNVTLGPGENTTVTFTYKPKDPGTYRVSMNDKSQTLMVEKSQSNFALIALIIIILIAIGAGAYLYKTGELEKLKKRMQGRQ